MKRKQQCEIVSDLLPNYIEKLTNKGTTDFIEEHLSNCSSCRAKLNNMSEPMEVEKANQKELDYLKKYRKKRKKAIILGIFIGVSIVILYYLGFILYRFYILNMLNNQLEEYNKMSNLYIEVTYLEFNNSSEEKIKENTSKYWYKDGVLKTRGYSNNEESDLIYIIDYNSQTSYRINDNTRTILTLKENDYNPFVGQDVLKSLIGINYIDNRYAFSLNRIRINQIKKLQGKSYYVIDLGNEQYIFDKNTKLLKCTIQYTDNSVNITSFKYEFDYVTEKDVALDAYEDYEEE